MSAQPSITVYTVLGIGVRDRGSGQHVSGSAEILSS